MNEALAPRSLAPARTHLDEVRRFLPVFLAEVLLIGVCIVLEYNYVFVAIAGVGVLVFIFASGEPVLASFGAGILLSAILWNAYSVDVPVFVHDIFLGFGLFVLLLQIIQGQPIQFRWSYLSRAVGFFIVSILIAVALGISYGRDLTLIAVEAHNLLYYVFFFILLGFLRNPERAKFITRFILGVFIFVSVQYVGIILERGSFGRVVSYNADFFVMTLPMFVAMLLYDRTKRFFATAGIVFTLAGLVISVTRAEWVAATVGSFIVIVIVLREKKFGVKAWLFLGMGIAFVASLLLIFGSEIESAARFVARSEVGAKAGTLGSALADQSLLMRIELNFTAFKRFLVYPIFGAGLGDVVRYKILAIGAPWSLDTSHLQILWKMGILGFIVYSWLALAVLKRSWFVFVRTNDLFFKWYCVGLLAGWIGTLGLSFFSAALTKYSLNVMFAVFIAVLESEALRLEELQVKGIT